jgi:tRNA threonylcarbamoyl adenosine modification protein YeaZ
MRVLAIDTSCGACSVAVYDSTPRVALASETVAMAQGHAEALAPMVQRAMALVEGGFASLDRIAVCVGPGSFTGIRIGLAMARAIGVALGVPVVGVSSLVAFAGPLLADPRPGVIISAIDARHGQIYFQLFEPSGRPLFAPRVAKLRDVIRLIGGGTARLCGNAAQTIADETAKSGGDFDASQAAPFPDIVAIARTGLALDPANAPPRPIYIKPPDAQPNMSPTIARAEGE